ncbi:MAG TPA: outer membrane beta-barrel protein, partial [Desulfuromonadaceae bacterium]
MRKRFVVILTASLTALAATAFAAVREGEFSLTPVVGGYTFEGKQHVETNPVYGIRAGYALTKNLGLEGLFDYVASRSTQGAGDFNVYRYGGEALYHFIPDSRLVPYVAAGFAGLSREIAGSMQKAVGAFDYGLGVKYALLENFALRGDVRHLIYSYNGSTYNNVEYTLGLHFPFGGTRPVAKAVEQPPVQEAPKAAAPPPAAPEPPPRPVSTLSAAPASITGGHTARLSWTSHHASECVIQPGIGPVPLQGDREVTPEADTTYTLTCTGAGGTTTSTAAIAVAAAPQPVAAPAEESAQKAAAAQRFCNK